MSSCYVAGDRQRISLSQAAKHASSSAGNGMFVQTYVSKQSWRVFGRVEILDISAHNITFNMSRPPSCEQYAAAIKMF
jgi:hypothetical protein